VPDGPGLHMLSGISAGLVATTLGSPMDVVSTRIMVNKQKGVTAGMVETCKEMLLKEGFSSFYQGVAPLACSHRCCSALCMHAIRHVCVDLAAKRLFHAMFLASMP
jgi:Mitochondrial carrier protein